MRKDIEEFDVRDAIREIIDVLKYQASRQNISIFEHFDCPNLESQGFKINTDSLRLQQVFLNLLSNALKYTQVGKVDITVKLRKTLMKQFISI